MAHWDDYMKWALTLPGTVAGLISVSATGWGIWKRKSDPANARMGNPELLATYLELHGKVPSYYPARNELSATIQEMILELSEDPARIRAKRYFRQRIFMIWFFMAFSAFGFTLAMSAYPAHVWPLVVMGSLLGVVCFMAFGSILVGFDKSQDREAEEIKAKRAAFMKDHTWPDKIAVAKKQERKRRLRSAPRLSADETRVEPTPVESSEGEKLSDSRRAAKNPTCLARPPA